MLLTESKACIVTDLEPCIFRVSANISAILFRQPTWEDISFVLHLKHNTANIARSEAVLPRWLRQLAAKSVQRRLDFFLSSTLDLGLFLDPFSFRVMHVADASGYSTTPSLHAAPCFVICHKSRLT